MRTLLALVGTLFLLHPGSAEGGPEFKVELLDVFVSATQGGVDVPHQPMVGDPYQLTARYRIVGQASSPFKLRFRMANRTKDVAAPNLGVGTHTCKASFTLWLDDEIDFDVILNPLNVGGGLQHPGAPTQKRAGTFRPREPATAVDYILPTRVTGTQRVEIRPTAGRIERVIGMIGQPDTDSWQIVKSASASVQGPGLFQNLASSPVENPGRHPVYAFSVNIAQPGPVVVQQAFTLVLRGQRVSPTLLRQATWNDVAALQGIGIFAWYTMPEAVAQSEHDDVRAFVEKALGGADYRKRMTPYDAARTLFQAVLAHCTYYYPEAGSPDLRAHNAVDLIKTGQGDCGSFSLLLVAVYRHIGLPARVACGGWVAADATHCWCEMFIPKGGWIVSDGSAGNAASEDGRYAYFFGTNLDLCARFALMRGNTFNLSAPALSTSWLQGPFLDVHGTEDLQYELKGSLEVHPFPTTVGRSTFRTPNFAVPPLPMHIEARTNGRPRTEPHPATRIHTPRQPAGR